MATRWAELLEHLPPGAGLTDGQLLGRFVAVRDEASFAALVYRHGPMVLGVCRRVLHDHHTAEDAFQATFLILARRAASVVKRESVGSWLYGVAYHTALRARAMRSRRQTVEQQVADLPHPTVEPREPTDWLPLLDRELSRLSEKYRAAILACDLEGKSRRDAARELGISEGTLSSRLAAGRRVLAKRLARCGLALSGAVTVGLACGPVPAALASSTIQTAILVAGDQLAGASAPAVFLMKEVMRAMLLKKLRLLVGAVLVAAVLGVVGLGYRVGGPSSGTVQAAPGDKGTSELEALRKENELLKLNLQVVLEKVRTQEAELRARRDGPAPGGAGGGIGFGPMGVGGAAGPGPGAGGPPGFGGGGAGGGGGRPAPGAGGGPPAGAPPGAGAAPAGGFGAGFGPPPGAGGRVGGGEADPFHEAEEAIKALRTAKTREAKERAAESLEKAMKKLREQVK